MKINGFEIVAIDDEFFVQAHTENNGDFFINNMQSYFTFEQALYAMKTYLDHLQ